MLSGSLVELRTGWRILLSTGLKWEKVRGVCSNLRGESLSSVRVKERLPTPSSSRNSLPLTGSYRPRYNLLRKGTSYPISKSYDGTSSSRLATWMIGTRFRVPVLGDIKLNGESRKAMLWANRNAFYCEFLVGKELTGPNLSGGLGENGRPIRPPNTVAAED